MEVLFLGQEQPGTAEDVQDAEHHRHSLRDVYKRQVKGTGVSFMTNSVDWHGKGPNDEEYAVAMQELNAAYAALEQEDK